MNAQNLGEHFASRDAQHLRRWRDALNAGKAKLPRCSSLTRTGVPCRHHAMHGTTYCSWHLRGAARITFDQTRVARLEKLARLSNIGEQGRLKALQGLRNIERYKLLAIWRSDPTIPGDVYALEPSAERRVRAFLFIELGLDLDGELEATGRPPSPRLRYRLRRATALFLQEKITRHQVQYRIRAAIQAETRFFGRFKAERVL